MRYHRFGTNPADLANHPEALRTHAALELVEDGVLSVDTEMALNTAGIDPDEFTEHLSTVIRSVEGGAA